MAIDRVTARAAAVLDCGARRARARLRERQPISRLGLDVIEGALSEIGASRLHEVLARVPEIASAEWWHAPRVYLAAERQPVDLVATRERIAAIKLASHRERTSRSRLETAFSRYAEGRSLVVIAVVDEQPIAQKRDLRCPSDRSRATSLADLAAVVRRELEFCGGYEPEINVQLSRLLHSARVARLQRETALGFLASGLDPERWIVAPAYRAPGLCRPIDVLAIGSNGIYACVAAGLEPQRAGMLAATGARAIARAGRGLNADVIPVVLCEQGTTAHQLELADRQRVWALAVDDADGQIRTAPRSGLDLRQVRRVRRPAPTSEYRIVRTTSGWSMEVRYDLGRHDRGQSRAFH